MYQHKNIFFPSVKQDLVIQLRKNFGDSFTLNIGFTSLKLVSISTFAILMSLKAINVFVISHFYLSEKMNLQKLVLIVLSFLGAFIIIDPSFFAGLVARVLGTKSDSDDSDSDSDSESRGFELHC